MLDGAVCAHQGRGQRLFLLGQIIHNPWVNAYFDRQGVRILTGEEIAKLERIVTAADLAIIPAFGVPLPIEQRLKAIGCEIVDTTCGDVRRLWAWAGQAAKQGFAVLIFGRSRHDETVVTKSRLANAGGKYLVVGTLEQARQFGEMIAGDADAGQFRKLFDEEATNADGIAPFERLAQVSQTTMLYDETMTLRDLVRDSFTRRYGKEGLEGRLRWQPTVCRATQDRQSAAMELCQAGCDLVIVVGGFGSSNTRHLFEVARHYCPAYFIEDAGAIVSRQKLRTIDLLTNQPTTVTDYLPSGGGVRIGVLAGASSPEVVVGEVLDKLASYLS
jgi:4-hydroxy-3-methylbut-2-en-1-yl diphosphate reductase